MMIILVTANNFLLMFVGWEGNLFKCLIWLSYTNDSDCFMHLLIYSQSFSRSSKKLKSFQGPHNLNIISLIVGSLLSSSYLEKREHPGNTTYATGTRIIFIKYSNNVEYLMWFHSVFALPKAGYCNPKNPKLYKLIKEILCCFTINSKVIVFLVLPDYLIYFIETTTHPLLCEAKSILLCRLCWQRGC